MSDLIKRVIERYEPNGEDERDFMHKHTDNVSVFDGPGVEDIVKAIASSPSHAVEKNEKLGNTPEESEDFYEEAVCEAGSNSFGSAINKMEKKRQTAIRKAKSYMNRTGSSAEKAAKEFDLLPSDVAKLKEDGEYVYDETIDESVIDEFVNQIDSAILDFYAEATTEEKEYLDEILSEENGLTDLISSLFEEDEDSSSDEDDEDDEELEEDIQTRYFRAHGKNASGQGNWVFTDAKAGKGKEFNFRGKFSDGVKAAKKELNTSNVYVMEDIVESKEDKLQALYKDVLGVPRYNKMKGDLSSRVDVSGQMIISDRGSIVAKVPKARWQKYVPNLEGKDKK